MLKRLVSVALLTGAAALGAVPAAHAANGSLYVAFGDSYASGPGLYGSDQNSCGRSATENYPERIAQHYGWGSPGQTGAVWADYTCAGALYNYGNASGGTSGGFQDQVNNWAANQHTLGSDTKLVTITIGGNDDWRSGNSTRESLYQSLVSCTYGDCTTNNASYLQPAEITTASYLGALQTTISGIHTSAANARVLLVGYPTTAPRTGQPVCSDPWGNWSITSAEATYVNTLMAKFQTVLGQAADQIDGTTNGGWLRTVDLYTPSNGHDFCRTGNVTGTSDTIRWVDNPIFNGAGSLHPTKTGMNEFAKIIWPLSGV